MQPPSEFTIFSEIFIAIVFVIVIIRSYWDTAGGGVLWDSEGEPVLDDVRSPHLAGSYHCSNDNNE